MKVVPVEKIEKGKYLQRAIYHESGVLLHHHGEVLTNVHKKVLGKCGIRHIIQPEVQESDGHVQEKLALKSVPVMDVKEGSVLARDVILPNKGIVARKGTVIRKDSRRFLLHHGAKKVDIEKTKEDKKIGQVVSYLKLLKEPLTQS